MLPGVDRAMRRAEEAFSASRRGRKDRSDRCRREGVQRGNALAAQPAPCVVCGVEVDASRAFIGEEGSVCVMCHADEEVVSRQQLRMRRGAHLALSAAVLCLVVPVYPFVLMFSLVSLLASVRAVFLLRSNDPGAEEARRGLVGPWVELGIATVLALGLPAVLLWVGWMV